MAEGGYKESVRAQSNGRKKNESPDMKKKRNPILGNQKRFHRVLSFKSSRNIKSKENDLVSSTGGDSDFQEDILPSLPTTQSNPQRTQPVLQSHLQDQLKPLARRGEYNSLDENYQQDQQHPHIQPLLIPTQVQSDSSEQIPNHLEQVTRELAMIELQRDRLRHELLEKDKRINEYEEKIVQYKTQLRQQQWTVQARMKELELSLADQERHLLAKDVLLKTLEEDKNKAELKAEILETTITEKEEQLNNLKTKVEECNKSITELQLELTKANSQVEEGKKSILDLKVKFTEVKTQADAQIAFLDKRYRDTQKLYDDQQLEKQTLEEELVKLKEQLHVDQKNSLKEQEDNKKLTEKVQRLEEESQKGALDATRQLDAKDKQIQEITTVKDEKEQVAVNLEKNVIELQQQLMETKLALEQMTTKNTELEDELTDLKETQEQKNVADLGEKLSFQRKTTENEHSKLVNAKKDQQYPSTQLLLIPTQVQSDSSEQFPSHLEQVTRELARIELQRDRLRHELLEKDKRINEYEEKIVQYKTQLRQQQWTVQARMKELELSLADQERHLLAKDVLLKTLEEDKNKAELKAEILETTITEKEEQLNNLKTKVEECNKSITELQLELTKANSQVEEGKKSILDLKVKFTEVKTQADAQIAFLDKRYRDTQKLYDDQQLEKQTLEEELVKLKEQLHVDQKNSLKEQEDNKKLTEKVQRLEEESQKGALDATRQLDAKDKQIQEITTVKDEKEQVAVNLEKNVIELQQQLMETKLALEQMTTKNTELEDELTDLKETQDHKNVADLEEKLSSQIKTTENEHSKLVNAKKDLQLLHEENLRLSRTMNYCYDLLKSKYDELQEVKATRDQFQQSILHLQQIQQKTEQARQDLQLQCHQQQQEYQEAVSVQKQHIGQLYHQLHWVVDEEEVTMTQEVLGCGSYGEVKVALFRGLRVAAKFLHDVIISDFNRGVFIREMDIASRVRHPNLVQFIGAIRGDTTIILTEIMSTSLYKELQKKAMTRSQILGISRDVALALNYLHLWKPNPIIHRDISTPNILLEPSIGDSFKAKVSDYGAANLQQDTKTDMPGNAAYAAPESRYPDDHTPAMDVYSYSVLLIVMILHCPPATTVEEREEQAKRVSWPSMSSLIHRCLDQDRHRRPTMTQILDLLLKV